MNYLKPHLVLGLLIYSLAFWACSKDDPPTPQRSPKAMSITRIDLLAYPAAKTDGSGWDLTTGPDIFLTLSEGSTANSSNKITSVFNDASLNSLVAFPLTTPVTINNLSNYWTIGAYDADALDPDDFISGGVFLPKDHQDGLPETVTLSNSSFSVKIYVTWNF